MQGLIRRGGGMGGVLALTVVAVGALVCVLWLAGVPDAARLLAASSTPQIGTGALFFLAGVSLLALAGEMPRAAFAAGAGVTLFAALTLLEYVLGANLGIDTLFLPLGPDAIRMAPNTAVAFLLAGLALLLLSSWRPAPWSAGVVTMAGALVIALGGTALIGYAIDLTAAFQWAGLTRMALFTAASFVLLGAALVVASIEAVRAAGRAGLPWLAAGAGVGTAALASLGWYAIAHAPAAPEHVANVVLALGLGAAALLAGVIAQAGHLHRQARELARVNEALRRASDEVADLYNHAPCGYHSLDRDGVFVRVNQTEADWLGYARDEMLCRMTIWQVLTPASQALARAEFPRFVRRGAIHNLELDFVRRDGTILPAIASATALYDARGNFLHSRTTVFDMTERRRAEAALRESESRLQTMLEGLQTAVVVHGPDTGIRYINPAAVAMLGLTRDQLMGKTTIDPYWHFVREDETPMPVEEYPVSRVLESRAPLHDCVVGIRAVPGMPTRWALVNGIPGFAADGTLREVIVSFMDISERKRQAEAMEHLALTDSLTGLATRRHFFAEAERELSRSRRSGAPMSLLMLDVDRFKSINDEHGHAVGDLVLIQLARTVRAILRDSDMAGRLGGEEICVLLQGTAEGLALDIAERLRLAIAATPVALAGGRQLRFTASLGVAMLEPDDEDLRALMDRADRAMYQAKRAGRNQVGVARHPVAH